MQHGPSHRLTPVDQDMDGNDIFIPGQQYRIHTKKQSYDNDKLGIFVTMDGGQVTVTNHTYSYFIKLNKTQWDKLINFFRKEMEFRAMEIEKELESQINHSLDNIYSKINL